MSALRRFLGREAGMTLVELMVGSLVATLTLAIVVVWAVTASRTDVYQEADFQALNDIRFAKAEMVGELRFADGVVSAATNRIDIWLDLDDSGGGAPDQPGELVTWEIVGTTLVRYEDNDTTTSRTLLDTLVPADSYVTLTGSIVEIQLTADDDTGDGQAARSVRTQVSLRNA